MELASSLIPPSTLIDNVYFGGGTPSTLSAELVGQLFADLHYFFNIDRHATISAEFSPETVSLSVAECWRAYGTTHASLGVQSFSDMTLHTMGRLHTAIDSGRAIRTLHEAGFSYVNIDLIYGASEQTDEQWCSDVAFAIESGATRVSIYPLSTLNKPALTAQYRNKGLLATPNSTYQRRHLQAINQFRAAGWSRPSALSFSLNDLGNPFEEAEAEGVPTLGIGCGARTYTSSIHASSTPPGEKAVFGQQIAKYYAAIGEKKIPVTAISALDEEERIRRRLVLSIVSRGIPKLLIDQIHDQRLRQLVMALLSQLEDIGHVVRSGTRLKLSDEGSIRAAEIGFRLASERVQRLLAA
jgi:oxygen-independent coproporphyrinogen-3 oxidase